MRKSSDNQIGAALPIGLLMLLLVNILTVASISSSNINMQIIQNQQRLLEMKHIATNVNNYILSDLDYFINYKNHLNSHGHFAPVLPDFLFRDSFGRTNVQIDSFKCLAETNATGCSLDGLFPCLYETLWQLSTSASDLSSGAKATIVEGVSFKYLPDHCP